MCQRWKLITGQPPRAGPFFTSGVWTTRRMQLVHRSGDAGHATSTAIAKLLGWTRMKSCYEQGSKPTEDMNDTAQASAGAAELIASSVLKRSDFNGVATVLLKWTTPDPKQPLLWGSVPSPFGNVLPIFGNNFPLGDLINRRCRKRLASWSLGSI